MPSHLILRKKCIQKAWIWFLENGTNCPLLVIGNKSTYVVDKGWERILPMKAYNNFKLKNKTSYFFINIVISTSRLLKNYPNVRHVPH